MDQMNTPPVLHYGWVRTLRFLPDFGRHEAAVVLRLADPLRGARDVELITSVADHPDEAPEALRQRLIFDAARLYRLSEVGLEDDSIALAA